MLGQHVERYLSLRATLGYKLRDTRRELNTYTRLARSRGEEFIMNETAAAWANSAPSPNARSEKMKKLILFAKFLHAEDERHQVPFFENYRYRYVVTVGKMGLNF